MFINTKLAKAVQLAVSVGAITSLGYSSVALSQTNEQAVDSVEKIQVTGSRIKRTDMEGASPVQIIDAETIAKTGLTSIGDILQDIPAAGTALNTAVNNGGDGSVRVDLRNLGAQRVLVLVNGRRWMNAASSGVGSSVDLNTIPVAAIQRIEVLKDGASAVYGSDAIAGVVNIITKKDYEGLDLNVYFGKTAEDDGHQRHFDITFGVNGDKGNFLASLNYDNQGTIWAGDRDISATGYSSSPPWGRYRDLARYLGDDAAANITNDMTLNGADLSGGAEVSDFSAFTTGDPALNPGNFEDVDPGDRYNYAPTNYLLTPNERTSVYLAGNYEVNDSVTFSSDFVYNNRKSTQILAPMPLTLGFQFGPLNGAGYIDANNPYNPFGQDLTFSPNADGKSIRLQRRMEEAGQRVYEQDVHTYRYSAGLNGEFRDWLWDTNFIYGESRNTSSTTGLLLLSNIFTALGDPDVCANTTGCVPINLFGQGEVTDEMVDFITFQGVDTNSQRLLTYSFNTSGDLYDLPAGPIGLAAGFEHRLETGSDTPNPYTQSGQSSGNQRNPTNGGFSMDELYVEVLVPVIEDLDLSLAARRTEHSSYGSNTTTKIGIEYRPFEDLLVRGTIAEGFRAPSIAELVGGGGDSYASTSDPCNDGGVVDGTVLPGCSGVPTTYTQANPQIRTSLTTETAPGEELQPELSDSTTFGVVYNPSYVEGLELTLDYFDIEVSAAITRLGAGEILSQCAETGTIYCDKIQRSSTGDVIELKRNFINVGGTETSGIDMSASYAFDTSDFGDFKVTLDATYVEKYNTINEDAISGDTSVTQQVGIEFGDSATPRWKANLNTDWNVTDDLSVSLSTRYIHSLCNNWTSYFDGCATQTSVLSANSFRNASSIIYNDLQVKYYVESMNSAFTVGMKNIFDRQPQMEADPENGNWWGGISSNNFNASLYDPNLARFVYMNIGMKF